MDKFLDQASNVVWVRYNKRVVMAERLCEFRNIALEIWQLDRQVRLEKLEAKAEGEDVPRTSKLLNEPALARAMESEAKYYDLLGYAEVFTIGRLYETIRHIKQIHLLNRKLSKAAFHPRAQFYQLPYHENWSEVSKILEPHFLQMHELFAEQIRELRFKLRRHVVYTRSKREVAVTDLDCCNR